MSTLETAAHVVVAGNPADGFVIVGPFSDVAGAHRYIEAEPVPDKRYMWVCELHAPAEEENA